MSEHQLTKKGDHPFQRALVRPDQNLLRWSALFTTSKFQGDSRELFFDTEKGRIGVVVGRHKKKNGDVVELGVLTVPELVSLCTLIQRWELDGKPQGDVAYSFAEFIRDSGKSSDGKKNYVKAHQSLRYLFNIPVSWHATFKAKHSSSAEEETYTVVEEMHLLSRLVTVKRKNKRSGKKEVIGFKFQLNPMLIENMLNGYTRPFNFRVLKSLKTELAKLTYAHLDTVMGSKPYTPSSTYLFAQLGLAGSYKKASHRLRRIMPVIEELKGARLSDGRIASIKIEPLKSDPNDFKIVFKKFSDKAIEQRLDRDAEMDYFVKEALEIVGEKDREITRKFLYKVSHHPKLGPDVVNRISREIKADVIDNKSHTNEVHLGKLLVSEIKKLAASRDVNLD